MKVLLDENIPHALRQEIPGHEVFTVSFMKWKGLKNGMLLAEATAAGFAAMVTMDSGVEYQQNIKVVGLCVIIIAAPSNDMDDLRPFMPALIEALNNVHGRRVIRIG